jgi:hypothetical protein
VAPALVPAPPAPLLIPKEYAAAAIPPTTATPTRIATIMPTTFITGVLFCTPIMTGIIADERGKKQ